MSSTPLTGFNYPCLRCIDFEVEIAHSVHWLRYGLHDRGSIPSRGTASKPGLGPTQPLIQCVTGALYPHVKWPSCKDDHQPPTVSRFKNAWGYSFILPYVSMAWY